MAKVKLNCSYCQAEILKQESEIKKSLTGLFYCNRSCAAKKNNIGKRRDGRDKNCKNCCAIIERRKTYCSKVCMNEFLGYKTSPEITLEELQNRLSLINKHPSWRNSYIRNNNRIVNKELLKENCFNCGYSLHVELCHIKAIKSFDNDSTLEEINNRNNIVQLCRNCHWEFDNGYLTLSS